MSDLVPKRPLSDEFEFLIKKRSQIDHSILAGVLEGDGGALYLAPDERGVHTYVVGVSGSGKSRFLQALILQDITKGHPLCLIDPMGDLYQAVKEFVASGTEEMTRFGFDPEEILEKFVFLDLTDAKNAVKFNPLAPTPYETVENQVDDLLKALERFLGSDLERQRILRNILRNVFTMTAELNRLDPEKRPPLPAKCRRYGSYPLNLRFAADLLLAGNEERLKLMDALGDESRLGFLRQYWEFFAQNSRSEQSRLIQSSWNVLQYVLADSLVMRVFDTHDNTVSIDEIFRTGQSLICHLPIGQNLTGTPFLGRYITTKLQNAAYRRPQSEWSNGYYLYIDEFHQFVDQSFANAMTNLRKFGLRLVNAHQSQSQPPFDTAEGRALLATIKGNSRIHVVFRLDRPDAETMSKELHAISEPELSHYATDRTESYTESYSLTHAFSFSVTVGTAQSWSRSKAVTLGRTQTLGIGRTLGTNIGQTLTNAVGGSAAKGLARAITESESRGITEAFNESTQMSVAVGENWAQVRDHRRGLTLTRGENESFAVQHGTGRDIKRTEQQGHTDTSGRSSSQSHGNGETLTHGSNGSVSYYSDGSGRYTSGSNAATARVRNAGTSHGENFSRAISTLRGVSKGLSESHSRTATQGSKLDLGLSESDGDSLSEGGSRVETSGRTRGRSRGRSREVGSSETLTDSTTETQSWQDSAAHAFSLLDQVSKTYSEALQKSWTDTESVSLTERKDLARGEQVSRGEGGAHTMGKTRREVYRTLEEKRERVINALQRLGNRQAYVTTEALEAQLIRTIDVPDQHYAYRTHDFPSLMIEMQRARLLPPPSATIDTEIPSNLLLIPKREEEDASETKPEGTLSPKQDEDDPFID